MAKKKNRQTVPDLPRVTSEIFGRPLLIQDLKLEEILDSIGPRLRGEGELDEIEPRAEVDPSLLGTVALIPVTGTLVHRHSMLSAMSGMTAYSDIGNAIDAAVEDPAIDAILLDVDSGGGAAAQCFDLVDKIYEARSKKTIWAVCNDSAMSGAYAIASAAEKILVSRTSHVGSIGVVMVHRDTVAADADAGLNYTIIRSGERKADGNPHEPLADAAQADMQAEADRIRDMFVETVARNRGMDAQAIRDTEAAIYAGPEAVKNGLADEVMTFDQAVAALSATAAPHHTNTAFIGDPMSQNDKPDGNAKPSVADPTPAASVTTTPAVAAPADRAAIEAQVRAEMAELNEVAAQASRLGVTVDVNKALAEGTKPDALRTSVLNQLADLSEANTVVSTPSTPAGEPKTPDAGAALDAALEQHNGGV